ncbi:MAG: hypothetical protein ACT6RF_09360 [Allorhizobium sp.]|uniref:hypothetical protein n=1 Tax=Allorhizobium sp. TaxID=633478 RepID=UPI00403348B9
MSLTIGSEFQQLARSMAPAFKTMLQTWVAVRHGISWEVRYCRTIFGTFVPPQLIPDIQIRTSSLRASRKVTLLGNPVEEVDALLAEPHRPVISEIEQTFSWESGSDSQFHRFYSRFASRPSLEANERKTLCCLTTSTAASTT